MKPLARDWHRAHPMPTRPSRAQRVAWHAEHAVVCGCREVPASLKADVAAAARNLELRGLTPDAPAPQETEGSKETS
jgi:hypothetical protein